jgi:hypothetical protein
VIRVDNRICLCEPILAPLDGDVGIDQRRVLMSRTAVPSSILAVHGAL